jgi:hypothetical protein
MPQPICDAGDRRINLQALHEQRIAHRENRARIKMRAQNRTTLTAIVLLVIAVFLLLRMYRQQNRAPTAVAEQPTEVPTEAVHFPVTGHGQESHPVVSSKNPAISLSAPVQDPTLRLELLMKSEGTEYASRKNIFRAAEDVGKPAKSPIKTALENAHADPPQYSFIALKPFGGAEIPGEPRKVFLSKGEDIFIAMEGDFVDRRYRVVGIKARSVEVHDLLNNNREHIVLIQD